MPEYIDRDTLIKTIEENPFTMSMGCLTVDECNGMNRARKLLAELFKTLPAADAVPVVNGEWFAENNRPKSSMFYCSICHRTCNDIQPIRKAGWEKRCRYAYCPNCGAKMDGGADNG